MDSYFLISSPRPTPFHLSSSSFLQIERTTSHAMETRLRTHVNFISTYYRMCTTPTVAHRVTRFLSFRVSRETAPDQAIQSHRVVLACLSLAVLRSNSSSLWRFSSRRWMRSVSRSSSNSLTSTRTVWLTRKSWKPDLNG